MQFCSRPHATKAVPAVSHLVLFTSLVLIVNYCLQRRELGSLKGRPCTPVRAGGRGGVGSAACGPTSTHGHAAWRQQERVTRASPGGVSRSPLAERGAGEEGQAGHRPQLSLLSPPISGRFWERTRNSGKLTKRTHPRPHLDSLPLGKGAQHVALPWSAAGS